MYATNPLHSFAKIWNIGVSALLYTCSGSTYGKVESGRKGGSFAPMSIQQFFPSIPSATSILVFRHIYILGSTSRINIGKNSHLNEPVHLVLLVSNATFSSLDHRGNLDACVIDATVWIHLLDNAQRNFMLWIL